MGFNSGFKGLIKVVEFYLLLFFVCKHMIERGQICRQINMTEMYQSELFSLLEAEGP